MVLFLFFRLFLLVVIEVGKTLHKIGKFSITELNLNCTFGFYFSRQGLIKLLTLALDTFCSPSGHEQVTLLQWEFVFFNYKKTSRNM